MSFQSTIVRIEQPSLRTFKNDGIDNTFCSVPCHRDRAKEKKGIALGLPTFVKSGLGVQLIQCIRSHFNQDGNVGRLSKEDLAFYDGIAERIRDLIEDSHRGTTIATLARDIGWGRSSLLNFLSRKTQTIQTHLLVRAAK
jgi:hypothetical protein